MDRRIDFLQRTTVFLKIKRTHTFSKSVIVLQPNVTGIKKKECGISSCSLHERQAEKGRDREKRAEIKRQIKTGRGKEPQRIILGSLAREKKWNNQRRS